MFTMLLGYRLLSFSRCTSRVFSPAWQEWHVSWWESSPTRKHWKCSVQDLQCVCLCVKFGRLKFRGWQSLWLMSWCLEGGNWNHTPRALIRLKRVWVIHSKQVHQNRIETNQKHFLFRVKTCGVRLNFWLSSYTVSRMAINCECVCVHTHHELSVVSPMHTASSQRTKQEPTAVRRCQPLDNSLNSWTKSWSSLLIWVFIDYWKQRLTRFNSFWAWPNWAPAKWLTDLISSSSNKRCQLLCEEQSEQDVWSRFLF